MLSEAALKKVIGTSLTIIQSWRTYQLLNPNLLRLNPYRLRLIHLHLRLRHPQLAQAQLLPLSTLKTLTPQPPSPMSYFFVSS
jgi:hypothetical protein